MNGGPFGFHNAPVTRAFIIASAAFSVIAGVRGRAASLGLTYQDVFGQMNIWRFISSAFSFSSTPEMMFGLYLLYYFRVFERQIGSNKHSVFILFSMINAALLEVCALAFLQDSSMKIASGPYGLIFASFIPFFFDIPVSTRFHVLSFNFSDKSFIYLAGLQLLLSSWKRSLLPGICGLVAGFLYRLNVFYIRRIKFPESIGAFFSRFSLPSSRGSQSAIPAGRNVGNMRSVAGRHLEVPRNFPAAARPIIPEPPEDAISMLVSMGFDRNSARQALMHARNDVNAATNILLETQSH